VEKFILALDQGTTSSRAILFDEAGSIRGMAQREFRQHFPQPGWVEHDADEIWESQIGVAEEVLTRTGIAATQIAAIGIANQRETTVLWDRETGRPLARAIVWQDRRTAELCAELQNSGLAPLFQKKTGLLLDAYFSGTKLKWLLDHLPDARQRARRGELAFGTIDTWLAWKLSGGRCHVTDASNASRTLLYNLHTRQWDDELLRILDIPRGVLPEVRPSSALHGHSAAHWLGKALPIAGIAGDQQAAMFGQACLKPGMAKNTYGTGCFMLMNTGEKIIASRHRLLTTVAWDLGNKRGEGMIYALEGSVFMGGATVQWLRDGLGIISQTSEIEPLAASVPDNGGVYLVPAFTGLGAPHWQPHARASLFGMSRGTGRGHIARAALEAIAFQCADVLKAMQQDSAVTLSELRVDGGAARNDLLMQFQADILDVAVVRPRITETTALGAAYLAGLAVGFWRSAEDIAAHWQSECRFEPAMSDVARNKLLGHWRAAVAQTLAWQEKVASI
jgi:glycerol kinase